MISLVEYRFLAETQFYMILLAKSLVGHTFSVII